MPLFRKISSKQFSTSLRSTHFIFFSRHMKHEFIMFRLPQFRKYYYFSPLNTRWFCKQTKICVSSQQRNTSSIFIIQIRMLFVVIFFYIYSRTWSSISTLLVRIVSNLQHLIINYTQISVRNILSFTWAHAFETN